LDFIQRIFGNINLYFIPAALICVTVHECSHGFAAMKLGDPTAKQLGRITLNPLKHIDIFGFIMLVLLGFGWAKPVPVDMRYFKKPKRDMAITALAGPASNFILAFVMLLMLCIMVTFVPYFGAAAEVIFNVLLYTATVSVGLGVFNLIPVSPLDGSKILLSLFPDNVYYRVLKYERYGIIILYAILFLGFIDTPLAAARSWVMEGMLRAAGTPVDFIAGLFR
jgi:Zn-dependent protease